jgi:hypothetical protein
MTLDLPHCNPYAMGCHAIKPQDLETRRTKVGPFRIHHALKRTKISNSARQSSTILVL